MCFSALGFLPFQEPCRRRRKESHSSLPRFMVPMRSSTTVEAFHEPVALLPLPHRGERAGVRGLRGAVLSRVQILNLQCSIPNFQFSCIAGIGRPTTPAGVASAPHGIRGWHSFLAPPPANRWHPSGMFHSRFHPELGAFPTVSRCRSANPTIYGHPSRCSSPEPRVKRRSATRGDWLMRDRGLKLHGYHH